MDPKGFDADDRIDATIALAQGLLQNYDGQPIWVSGILDLPPSPQYSIFSRDLTDEDDERGMTRLSLSPWDDRESLRYTHIYPKGTLDDEGYFSFVPDQVSPITKVEGTPPTEEGTIEDINSKYWHIPLISIQDPSEMPGDTMLAVKIFREYDRIEKSDNRSGYVVVQMHAPGKYHRVDQFQVWITVKEATVLQRAVDWVRGRAISIGGPMPYKKPVVN